jgi:aldehyde dehydrogenase (NAD+)
MTTPTHEARLFINGELRDAQHGAVYPNTNPATGDTLGVAADASPADVEAAIVAARHAFDTTDWSRNVTARVRGLRQLHQALREHADELADIIVAEVGAPRGACSTVQVDPPIDGIGYYADLAENYAWRTDLGTRDTIGGPAERWIERRPIGVVAAITPWNVPNQINLAKIVPALAAGCTTILKAAPDTPWTALWLGRMIAEHTDIPTGVVNIITAQDPTIGELLTTDPRVDMVSFTGSTAVGRRVMEAASQNLTKVFLELGGKSVSLVLDDVEDFGMAAAVATFGTATVAGQGCALTTRILLPRSRYQEGVDAIATMMASVTPDNPGTNPHAMMGPLINPTQRQRVDQYVQDAVRDGARVVCGGKPYHHPDHPHGSYYEMTLLADVTNDMAIAREEVFGPVLVAIAYDHEDDAIAIANDSIYGLSGAVFSGNETRAIDLSRRIRTGTMSINGAVWYSPDVPFGGYKQSGLGREMGQAGFEEHLEITSFARPA